MTKERKLAIKMWEGVKEHLPQWYEEDRWDIVDNLRGFKADFCFKNNLHWNCYCWFCQYFRDVCDRCPLKSCDYTEPTTAWARIVDEDTSLEIKLQAVDEIIAALKGEPRPHIEEVKQ